MLRRIIRTKVDVGMHIINELPAPIGKQAKKIIHILQGEFIAYMQEDKQPTEIDLKKITIE